MESQQSTMTNATATLTAATELQQSLTTVMGPCPDGHGTVDSATLQQEITALGTPPATRASDADKQAYAAKITELINKHTKEQSQQAYKQAADQATQALSTQIDKIKEAAQTTLQACEQEGCEAEQAQPQAQTERNKAIKAYNEDIKTITSLMKQIDNLEVTLQGINMQINTLHADTNTEDPTAHADRLDKLHKMRRNFTEQKTILQQDIINHYDSAISRRGKTKDTLIDLQIPKDITRNLRDVCVMKLLILFIFTFLVYIDHFLVFIDE